MDLDVQNPHPTTFAPQLEGPPRTPPAAFCVRPPPYIQCTGGGVRAQKAEVLPSPMQDLLDRPADPERVHYEHYGPQHRQLMRAGKQRQAAEVKAQKEASKSRVTVEALDDNCQSNVERNYKRNVTRSFRKEL